MNITSIAGRVAALAQSPYVASKWALEGLSEGLAQELAPFGVRVVIIEPGVTKSAIFAKSVDTPNTTGAYADHYRRMFQMYATGISQATDPFEVAEVIHHATTDRPELRYRTSWGGDQLIRGREAMDDAEWVSLGTHAGDGEYYARFEAVRAGHPPGRLISSGRVLRSWRCSTACEPRPRARACVTERAARCASRRRRADSGAGHGGDPAVPARARRRPGRR